MISSHMVKLKFEMSGPFYLFLAWSLSSKKEYGLHTVVINEGFFSLCLCHMSAFISTNFFFLYS